MSTEQRQHTRHPVLEQIIYSTMDTSGTFPERVYHPGIIVNKSQGGVGMRVTSPHQVNDTLWLEGIDDNSAARLASIRWVKELETDELFEMGLQY